MDLAKKAVCIDFSLWEERDDQSRPSLPSSQCYYENQNNDLISSLEAPPLLLLPLVATSQAL